MMMPLNKTYNSTWSIFPVKKRIPSLWLLVFSLTGFLLSSCEEKIDWELKKEHINTIVVDAILTNEFKEHEIRLTRPFHNPNELPEPVTGAQVIVKFENDTWFFEEMTGNPGVYKITDPEAASIGEEYKLIVQNGNKEYTATTNMVPVLGSSGPSWLYHEDADLYQIGWPTNQYSPDEQAMYEAEIDWTHLLNTNFPDSVTRIKIMYYTFNTIDVSYVIAPQDKEEVFFPRFSFAVVKKYSLTDEYADYLRALLAETEWQGSLFEEVRGNLPSNISNGGLGYFSACSVLVDSLFVF